VKFKVFMSSLPKDPDELTTWITAIANDVTQDVCSRTNVWEELEYRIKSVLFHLYHAILLNPIIQHLIYTKGIIHVQKNNTLIKSEKLVLLKITATDVCRTKRKYILLTSLPTYVYLTRVSLYYVRT